MAAAATTWPTSTNVVYPNVVTYSFLEFPYYQGQFWTTGPLNVSRAGDPFDRPAFDRLMLARIARPLAEPAARLSFLNPAVNRRPELVRRAPRPAGRPYGWRRRRKGGRWT